jgi:hypothetical protein
MLNFSDEDVRTNNKVDGGKLFSFIRNKYKVDKQELFENRILEILNRVRERINLYDDIVVREKMV